MKETIAKHPIIFSSDDLRKSVSSLMTLLCFLLTYYQCIKECCTLKYGRDMDREQRVYLFKIKDISENISYVTYFHLSSFISGLVYKL